MSVLGAQDGRGAGHLAVDEVEDISVSVQLLVLIKGFANPPLNRDLKDNQGTTVVERASARGGELKRWAKTAWAFLGRYQKKGQGAQYNTNTSEIWKRYDELVDPPAKVM